LDERKLKPGEKSATTAKPKTRNVFVDTSAFINENFAVKSTAFKSLLSLCRMGKAALKLTDVTVREIESNVQKCLKGANKALQEKTRDTRILKNFDHGNFSVLFGPLDEDHLCSSLMRSLKADFDGAKAEIISATTISPAIIFDKYFQKQPPFGPAKKKEEFPDAFVLTALEQWCAAKKQRMYVVSSDGDLESGCGDRGPLIHLKSIAEFVDLVLRAEEDEADFLAQFFVDNPQPIIEAVTHGFEDRYLYLHDEDGDGEASVSDVKLGSAAVVSLSDNEVVLELDATVSFSAHVSYGESWDHKSADLDRTATVPVEVTIQFERPDYLHYQVTSSTVNNGESLHVYVDEDAETHWK
jgi:hypothetical protein